MQVRSVGLAHVGMRRERNEDCWLADDQLGLYLVADGMGGHRGGATAARLAVHTAAGVVREAAERIAEVAAGTQSPRLLARIADQAIQAATRAVFEAAARDSTKHGMGCTLTLVLCAGRHALVGQVGDSRAYLARDADVELLTHDHTVAAELARAGAVPAEEVRRHPYRSVLTRSIGAQPAVQADLLRLDLLPEDRLLLCSDGLSNYLHDTAWLVEQLVEEDLDGIPDELVRHANDCGGADNITAVVVAVEAEPGPVDLAAAADLRDRLAALEACFLCEGLSLARQAAVLGHTVTRALEPGEVLVPAGEPIPGLILVLSGALGLTGADGRSVTFSAGDQLGRRSLVAVDGVPASGELAAVGKTRCVLLSPAGLRAICRQRPRLGVILLRRLALELAQRVVPAVPSG